MRKYKRRLIRQLDGGLRLRIFCVMALGIVSLLGSCSPDHLEEPYVPPVYEGNVLVNINVSMRLSGGAPQTRSENEYELSLTDEESRIERLVIMLVDLDASGKEIPDNRNYDEVINPDVETSVKFCVKTTPGPKHVYLVANMSAERAIDAVSGNQPVAVTGTTYESVISEFVKLDNAVSTGANRAGSDIAMSGQATLLSGQKEIYISAASLNGSSGTNPTLNLAVTLQRCVAKVMLTCKIAVNKTGGKPDGKYVMIRDPQSTKEEPTNPNNINNSYNGWMHIEDVWFVLNNSNRRTYIMQQQQLISGTECVSDPNFALSDYIHLDNYTYTPKLSVYADNFISFNDSELKLPEAIDGIPFAGATCRMRALPYDATRADPKNLSRHYTEGLYCLENTLLNDFTLTATELQTVPRMGSTYLVIGARYVPKYIYDGTVNGTNNDIVGQSCLNMTDALSKLAQVNGKDENDNDVTYPEGTFFYYYDGVMARFCTYEGMIKWIEISKKGTRPLTRRDFLEYKAGWGYYSSYITGDVADKPDEYGRYPMLFKDKGDILRNYYYMLQASLFYVPGSNLPTNNLILINSQRLEWKPRGHTGIIVKPK